MSRYAMEWAKAQALDAEAKVVLLVISQDAQGPRHVRRYYDDWLAREAGFTAEVTEAAVERLVTARLLSYTPVPDLNRPRRVVRDYSLTIPAGWRTQAARLPRREPVTVGAVPTAVYRLYDVSGRLLYVGISDRPGERFGQHAISKPWWHEVVTRELHWYYDLPPATAEEERAIEAEKPLYNFENQSRSQSGTAPRRRYVVANGRYARFAALVDRLRADVHDLKFDDVPLPEADALAELYACDAVMAQQALNWLVADGVLEYLDGALHAATQAWG